MSQHESEPAVLSLLAAGVETDVSPANLAVIVDELHAIADGTPRFAEAVELAERLEAFGRMARPISVSPAPGDRGFLLRACDHLCQLGYDGSLHALRDSLSGLDDIGPISYQLVFADDRPPADTTSRSGEYVERDRLVTSARAQVRVVDVRDGTLVVDDWRPLAWHPTSLGW